MGLTDWFGQWKKRIKEHRAKEVKNHEEFHKIHAEFHRRHREFRRREEELKREYKEIYKQRTEIHRYHKHMSAMRFGILIFNLALWFILFKFGGIKTASLVFVAIISVIGVLQFLFFLKIENRILKPIELLKNAAEEIGKGNYNVKVELYRVNELDMLIDAFNEMAGKLLESERKSAESEENRKALIANISHDLKTPITSVQGYVEAILDGNAVSPENTARYLKIIYSNMAYMNKLIDDLFLFSKLDMQKLDFQFEKTAIRPFMRDLMEEFRFEVEEKQIRFSYNDRMTEAGYVNIDHKRLHQVLRNIIGNAVKYGSGEDQEIQTELFRTEDYVCVDIRDNGPGIPPDKLSKIFDRFFRIDTERTKDLMSTGLGLAIAKELVTAHGGTISVSSKEGEGTCFTVKLPVV